jgi:hypothetical protein
MGPRTPFWAGLAVMVGVLVIVVALAVTSLD